MISNFLRFFKSRFFWINIIVAISLIVIVVALMLFLLKQYTHHGESIEVPSLTGLYENEVEQILKKDNLGYLIIDSVYKKNAKPGAVMEQTPKAGLSVKKGRVIFLTINSKSKKMVALPNVINVSERQATYSLKSLGFNVGEVQIVPSEYSDMLIEIKSNGQVVEPGSPLPDGTILTLVVGRNDSTYQGQMTIVPSFIGMNVVDAKQLATQNNLVIGFEGFDSQPTDENDKLNYQIYKQVPEANSDVIPGKRIDFWLSKDKQKWSGGKKENDDFF